MAVASRFSGGYVFVFLGFLRMLLPWDEAAT
jgi:hypothetical protein